MDNPPNEVMSPAQRARAALGAFARPDLAPEARPDAIAAALRMATSGSMTDYAGVYGALHALAPALDALRTDEDLRIAIDSRADQQRAAGGELLALHGAALPPWPVVRIDMDAAGAGVRGVPRLMLRPQKAYGTIRIDALTTICNVPAAVWEHAIGEDALMELEFATWRGRAALNGPDVAVDKEALTRRIAWLCRIGVETRRVLEAR